MKSLSLLALLLLSSLTWGQGATLPFPPLTGPNGTNVPFAKLTFCSINSPQLFDSLGNCTQTVSVFEDSGLTTPYPGAITTDGLGNFPPNRQTSTALWFTAGANYCWTATGGGLLNLVPVCFPFTVQASSASTGGSGSCTANKFVDVIGVAPAGPTCAAPLGTVNGILAANGSGAPSQATGGNISGSLFCPAASGSSTAYTCTTTPSFTPVDGTTVFLDCDVTSGASPTLAVNGASAAPIKQWTAGASSPIAMPSGGCQANQPIWVYFDSGLNIWSVMSPTAIESINGGAFPTSATVIGSNGSAQPVAVTPGGIPVNLLAPGTSGQCLNTSGSTPVWGSCAGNAGMQLTGSPNTTPASASASTTSFQSLGASCASTPCFGAGALNSSGKTFTSEWWGDVTASTTSQSISFQVAIGGGTISFAGGWIPPNTTGFPFHARIVCTVTTTGNPGQATCAVTLWTVNGCFGCVSPTTSNAIIVVEDFRLNPATTSINWTGTISPTLQVSFSVASTGNVAETSYAYTQQWN